MNPFSQMAKAVILGLTFFILGSPTLASCAEAAEKTTITFKHGVLFGNPKPFAELLRRFEKDNPGITVKDETLPASSDEQHQFFAINFAARSSDFDVISLDVIWVPEFANAGWIRDLTGLMPADEWRGFFSGDLEAVTYRGRYYAVPWYIDAGLLYYRKDLLEKYGFPPPTTWYDLVRIAQDITKKEGNIYGFVWQGKQYEGLVCNVLEYIWSNGGDVLIDGKPVINRPQNVQALQFVRDLVATYKVSPPFVLTATEDPVRQVFGDGKAIFMRNWPYAWNIFQEEGSAVKGKVGIMPLPAFPGGQSAATLGGFQLGVNRYTRHPEASEKLVKFLASPEAQKALALTIGYKPTRKAVYNDKELIKEQPFTASLFEIFLKVRPRPVTPYYMQITQVLQTEFSAALSGGRTPGDALNSAQRQITQILGGRQ